jgi:hypothetical protein
MQLDVKLSSKQLLMSVNMAGIASNSRHFPVSSLTVLKADRLSYSLDRIQCKVEFSSAAAVVTVTDWTSRAEFLVVARISYLKHSVETGSGSTLFPIQWVPGALSPG